MATLHIESLERPLAANLGRSLLDLVLDARHPIATACGGVAACGQCRVEVLEGMDLLRPVSPREVEHLGNLLTQRGWRLACQARLVRDGEVRVRVPPVVDTARRKQAKLTEQLRQRRQAQAEARRRPGSGEPGRGGER